MRDSPLLAEAMPDLATELERDLRLEGHATLADQVTELRMTAPCGCGDSFCTSFYTGPVPEGPWEGHHQNVITEKGGLILDVVDGKIRFIEVLDRGSLRPKLRKIFRG